MPTFRVYKRNVHIEVIADSFIQALEQMKPDLSGLNLFSLENSHGQNLQGIDLEGCDLSESVLIGVNLSNANLSGAKSFANAKLNGTEFFNANLEGASFHGADMREIG